jgi:hypothetical protein
VVTGSWGAKEEGRRARVAAGSTDESRPVFEKTQSKIQAKMERGGAVAKARQHSRF